jgi:hypothetical protein
LCTTSSADIGRLPGRDQPSGYRPIAQPALLVGLQPDTGNLHKTNVLRRTMLAWPSRPAFSS